MLKYFSVLLGKIANGYVEVVGDCLLEEVVSFRWPVLPILRSFLHEENFEKNQEIVCWQQRRCGETQFSRSNIWWLWHCSSPWSSVYHHGTQSHATNHYCKIGISLRGSGLRDWRSSTFKRFLEFERADFTIVSKCFHSPYFTLI